MRNIWGSIICIIIGVFGMSAMLQSGDQSGDAFFAFFIKYATVFFIIIICAGIFMLMQYIRNRKYDERNIKKIREAYLNHIIYVVISVLVIIMFTMYVIYSVIMTGTVQVASSRIIAIALFVYFLIRQLQAGKQLRKDLRDAETQMRDFGYVRGPR